jgi:hypothetical protein
MTAPASIDTRKYGRLLAKAMPLVIDSDQDYERMLAQVAKLMAKKAIAGRGQALRSNGHAD